MPKVGRAFCDLLAFLLLTILLQQACFISCAQVQALGSNPISFPYPRPNNRPSPKRIASHRPFRCLPRRLNGRPICTYQPPNRLPPRPAIHSRNFNFAIQQADDLFHQLDRGTNQESNFSNFGALARWGWNVSRVDFSQWSILRMFTDMASIPVKFRYWTIAPALDGLGISTTSPPLVLRDAYQDEWFWSEDGVKRVSKYFISPKASATRSNLTARVLMDSHLAILS